MKSLLGWALTASILLVVVALPLFFAVDAAFYEETKFGLSDIRSFQAILDVYSGADYLGYLGITLVISALVTSLSMAFGVTVALIIGRSDFPFKKTVDVLILLPLFLSPFTGLMAWILLGSEKTGLLNIAIRDFAAFLGFNIGPLINVWSIAGVIWVLFLFFAPLAYLFTLGSLTRMDASLEESARTAGASLRTVIFKITLPICAPALFAAGLLIFILAAEVYTIPGIIGSTAGFTTLPWQIFLDSSQVPVHRAHAAAGGTLLILVTTVGLWFQHRLTRVSSRYVSVSGKTYRSQPIQLGKLIWPAGVLIFLYVLTADILPFFALLMSSLMRFSALHLTPELFTFAHYINFFSMADMMTALRNTALLAVLSGVVCVLLGTGISLSELRSGARRWRILSFLATIPVAVPGIVFAIGLLWAYASMPIYGTIWVLLLAYVAKFLPYSVTISRASILQIHPDLESAARICGASAVRARTAITLPLLKATLMSIFIFVALMSIRELSASILLYAPGSQVLSVLTWVHVEGGDYQFAAAVGVIQTSLLIGLLVGTRAVFKLDLIKSVGS